MFEKRVHLFRDKRHTKRTTISLEKYLYEVLAIHLGCAPDDGETLSTVTEWLQNKLFEDYDKDRARVSQFLKKRIIFEIMDKKLSERYLDWQLSD
jgi:hypothetical protein